MTSANVLMSFLSERLCEVGQLVLLPPAWVSFASGQLDRSELVREHGRLRVGEGLCFQAELTSLTNLKPNLTAWQTTTALLRHSFIHSFTSTQTFIDIYQMLNWP